MSEMIRSLEGQVALVTGASSGIGEATAIALAEAGVRVVVAARRLDRLEQIAAGMGEEAFAVGCDVADEKSAAQAVAATIAGFGRIDILVNAAGIIRPGGAETLAAAEWRKVIDINLMGIVHCCRAAIPAMRSQGSGHIVNVSSLAGRQAVGALGAYTASKFAVSGLSESMRLELGTAGIRVCTIDPGQTRTGLAKGLGPRMAVAGLNNLMEASDVAETIRFVVSLPPRANVSQITIQPSAPA